MSQLLQLACPTAPNPARPPSKNRVGGSPRPSSFRAPKNRSQLPESHRVSRPDATIAASGRSVWPNRDPIGEIGGINIYQMLNNNAVESIDLLGAVELDTYINLVDTLMKLAALSDCPEVVDLANKYLKDMEDDVVNEDFKDIMEFIRIAGKSGKYVGKLTEGTMTYAEFLEVLLSDTPSLINDPSFQRVKKNIGAIGKTFGHISDAAAVFASDDGFSGTLRFMKALTRAIPAGKPVGEFLEFYAAGYEAAAEAISNFKYSDSSLEKLKLAYELAPTPSGDCDCETVFSAMQTIPFKKR